MERFAESYRKLNAAQKEAVDAIEGPVMVIAGPGTGKTQLLTVRIANIIRQTDTPPSGILALTFTESGARAMRERLVGLVGSPGYAVPIHTFHGLASELVSRYPERYPSIIGSALASDVEQIDTITNVINDGTWEHLAPAGDPAYYVGPVRGAIAELKRENLTPESLREWCERQRSAILADPSIYHQKGKYAGKMKSDFERELRVLARTSELADAFGRYQALMRERRLYDYDDLIIETVVALGNDESFLREVQEQYLYILADEHQDVNASQNALLEYLASFHESPNLFVVGDEKQAIFRFQGASLANFLYFKRRYPEAKVIVLSENYRSHKSILDSAHSMIVNAAGDTDLPRVPLRSVRGEGPPIPVRAFSTQEDELAFLAHDIERQIAAGVAPGDIAVLYRANHDASPISRALSARGIPHAIESDFDALEDPHIEQFVGLLRAIAGFGDDSLLAPVLYFGFTGIVPVDAHRAIAAAKDRRIPLSALLTDPSARAVAGLPDGALSTFADRLSGWVRAQGEFALAEFLELAARESGFVARLVIDPGAPEKLGKLRALLRAAEALVQKQRLATLSDFIAHLAVMREHRVRLTARGRAPSGSAVRLMTVHKSKGLEFDCVYVVGLVDGAWGSRSNRRLFKIPYGAEGITALEGDDDERRLLYVAITRGRASVALSYFAERLDGGAARASKFIEEIDPNLIALEDHSTRRYADLTQPPISTPSPLAERDYLRELFLARGLTVTSINNYLACPWQYFFTNLIRIPEAKNEAAHFGTAVHAALSAAIRSGSASTVEPALSAFSRALESASLSAAALRRLRRRGEKAISGFIDARPERFGSGVQSEVRIAYALEHPALPTPLPLSGVIDALEAVGGGWRVIDFKTGKPKTRGVIEGTAKAERSGDYLRQLLFYRFLLARSGEGAATEGVLDFVEPDAKGEYRSEAFALSDAQEEPFAKDVERIIREIYDLSFWDRECGRKDCPHCRLRSALLEAR